VVAGRYDDALSTNDQLLELLAIYCNGIDYYNFLVFHREHLPTNKRTLLENGELFTVK